MHPSPSPLAAAHCARPAGQLFTPIPLTAQCIRHLIFDCCNPFVALHAPAVRLLPWYFARQPSIRADGLRHGRWLQRIRPQRGQPRREARRSTGGAPLQRQLHRPQQAVTAAAWLLQRCLGIWGWGRGAHVTAGGIGAGHHAQGAGGGRRQAAAGGRRRQMPEGGRCLQGQEACPQFLCNADFHPHVHVLGPHPACRDHRNYFAASTGLPAIATHYSALHQPCLEYETPSQECSAKSQMSRALQRCRLGLIAGLLPLFYGASTRVPLVRP